MLIVLLAKLLWYVNVNNLEVLDAELWVMLPPQLAYCPRDGRGGGHQLNVVQRPVRVKNFEASVPQVNIEDPIMPPSVLIGYICALEHWQHDLQA